jgi:hypothetical protein
VGVLFEEGDKPSLERIEFVSRWSGKSVETRISAKSSRFMVALEFAPRDLNRLSMAGDRPSVSATAQMSTSIDVVTPLITERVAKELLSDELSGTKFLILDPKRQEFNHQIFSFDAASAIERTIPTIVLSRSGEILASTIVTMYLPE